MDETGTEETGGEVVRTVPTFGTTRAAKLPGEREQNHFLTISGSPLLQAAKSNSAGRCRYLLDSDSCLNPNLPSPGWTALHFAAHFGYLTVVEALLDYLDRIDLNPKTELLQTPLHLACLSNHNEVVKSLVRAGANLDSVDIAGNTPLHTAVLNGSVEVAEWLVAKGGDLTIRNLEGKTPSDLAGKGVLSGILAGIRKRDSVESSSSLRSGTKSRTLSSPLVYPPKPSPFDFHPLQSLGRGSFGQVYLVQHRDSSRLYAMKVLPKAKLLHQNLIKYAITERNITCNVKHPFIVGLKFAFQTEEKLFLILDYCPGGDLGWHLKREKRFSESRARMYVCEVILAVEELHRRNVIFRDLKPDNVLLDGEGHAMLTDFGLSKEEISSEQTTTSFCGSVSYLAPEVLMRKGHGKAVDWYLLGVLLYEMLVGQPPYYSANHDQLFSNILRGKLKLPSSLSPDARSLLLSVGFIQLLQRNPGQRLGSSKRDSEELKEHRFFYGVDWESVHRRELKTPILPRPTLDLGSISEEKVFGSGGMEKGENGVMGWSFVSPNCVE